MLEAMWLVRFASNTPDAGAGVVVLETGRIFGGDGQYAYLGTYRVKDDTLTAEVRVRKHTDIPGGGSIFGPLDSFDLALSGKVARDSMTLTGHVKQNPQMRIVIDFKRFDELP